MAIRDDEGLAEMLAYKPPAPETTRQWLDGFHDEVLMTNRPLQGNFIPSESNALAELKEINRRDVDTHLIETNKAGAKFVRMVTRHIRP